MPKPTTAILLFALPDATESGRKTVSRHSVTVWRAMRLLAQAKVCASGLPLLQSRKLVTHQGTFGEQISTALSAAFAQGYEQVICIGNDCPGLAISDLLRAATSLANNKTPIGADQRGGVYLFGITRQQFDGQAVTQLPWQTTCLADALRSYLNVHPDSITQLPIRSDVNQRIDATGVRWSGQAISRLVTLIREALSSASAFPVTLLFVKFSVGVPRRVCGRAPPLV